MSHESRSDPQPLLREGDIIELREGHTVCVELPQHCCYENAFGNFAETAQTAVQIGEVRYGLNTGFLVGRYVVVNASLQGGGTGMGPGDVYPDGWHITAQRLMATKITSTGRSMSPEHPLRVSFYQTGCFTAMIPDITAVGRATAQWSEA